MIQDIERYLGSDFLALIIGGEYEELYINPDGVVRGIHPIKGRTIALERRMSPESISLFIRSAAGYRGLPLRDDHPAVASAIEQDGLRIRIQGYLPPMSAGPSLIVRIQRKRHITLDDYVAHGTMSVEVKEELLELLQERTNIIIAGGTGSGKTTLLNALIRELPISERLLIIEDTDEIVVPEDRDCLKLVTTEGASMKDLVRHALRSTPDRIIVGEVRDEAARDLLEAWTTGHPGGLGTVHGETPEKALNRLARLASYSLSTGRDLRPFVAEAVGAVVMIYGRGGRRRVEPPVYVIDFNPDRGFILRARKKNSISIERLSL